MKLARSVLVLGLLAALSAPAHAATTKKFGLVFADQGSCVSSLDATGALVLDDIGSSGNDGVHMQCLHMDGMSLSLDGATSPQDAGVSQTFTYRWALTSRPAGSNASLSLVRTPTRLVVSSDLSDFASPASVHCVLSRGGQFVADVPGTYVVQLRATDALGNVSEPRLSVARTRHSATLLPSNRMHASVSFPSMVTVELADGSTMDCDDLDFTCAIGDRDKDCDGVSCDFRVSAPAGSSFTHVRCSDGSCRALDHDVTLSGGTTLVAAQKGKEKWIELQGWDWEIEAESSMQIRNDRVLSLGDALSRPSSGGSGAVAMQFSPPSLTFDPAVDAGRGEVMTIFGRSSSCASAACPATDVRATVTLTVTGSNFFVRSDHSQAGAVAESCIVLSHGAEVARGLMPAGGVLMHEPPGGSAACKVKGAGIRAGYDVKSIKTALAQTHAGPADREAGSGGDLSPRLRIGCVPCAFSFTSNRVFVVGGADVQGDEIVCFGDVPNDGRVVELSSLTCTQVRSLHRSGPPSNVPVLAMSNDQSDVVIADMPAASAPALSSKNTFIDVPFTFHRTDNTGVRGYSVTFSISPELLSSCSSSGSTSPVCVTEGSYLGNVAPTQFFVTDNGGGSFTVDCSIFGPVCGAQGDGNLFSLRLSAAAPVSSDHGVVSVDDVVVRDCLNHPVPGVPGGVSIVPIDFIPPGQLPLLTASQQKFNNGPRQTTSVQLSWPDVEAGASVQVFVQGFGNYPSYAHGATPGAVPPVPVSRADAVQKRWLPANFRLQAGADGSLSRLYDPASRDFLYFCAFVVDDADNESAVSNMTPGTLDYHLGDVSDGVATCTGDDHVTLADVSFLGSHYGQAAPPSSSYSCLDVGPTSDFSVDAMPTTDGRVNFEELMVFSMNFSVVSAPQLRSHPSAMAVNAARVNTPALPPVGSTFDLPLVFDGAGDALGVSMKLDYNHDVLEPVGVANGALLDQQDRAGVVFSSEPGDVDVALLGSGTGISGSGEVARVTFRVKASGDPALAIKSVVARDAQNKPVTIAGVDGAGIAVATGLGFSYPNPFAASTAIRMSLRQDGDVKLAVYDIAGRRVRVLLSGSQPAGARTVTWDGRDDGGLRMAPGAYVVRMEMANHRESRTVRLVR